MLKSGKVSFAGLLDHIRSVLTYRGIATKSRLELSEPGVGPGYTRSGMRGGGENPHDA